MYTCPDIEVPTVLDVPVSLDFVSVMLNYKVAKIESLVLLVMADNLLLLPIMTILSPSWMWSKWNKNQKDQSSVNSMLRKTQNDNDRPTEVTSFVIDNDNKKETKFSVYCDLMQQNECSKNCNKREFVLNLCLP